MSDIVPKQGRGGKRLSAGRPPLADKRKMRGIKCNNAEWSLITSNAALHNKPVREYILSLIQNK
jgi:hypothetical protein